MSFVPIADATFPGVEWDGKSSIHVSIARSVAVWPANKTSSDVIARLAYKGVGHSLFRFLRGTFPALDFLISGDEFNTLFLKDTYRHLKGRADRADPNKIVNPKTKSVFSLIARKGSIVAGIRFWVEHAHLPEVGHGAPVKHLCYRFRITTTNEKVESTTVRIRAECSEALTELEAVGIIDIAEPPKEQQQTTETQALFEEGEAL